VHDDLQIMKSFSLYFGIFLSVSLIVGSVLFLNRYYISQWIPGEKYLPEMEAFADSVPSLPAAFRQARWVHRVNSVERLQEVRPVFNGLEIDLWYDEVQQALRVGHDADSSFHLELSELLSSADSLENCYLWLDIKSLDTINAPEIYRELSRLDDRFDIRARTLVESPCPQALTLFTDEGYLTSYYLPSFHVFKSSRKELRTYYDQVQNALRDARVNALSGNHMQFLFMEKYFPGYDHLLWNLDKKEWRRNRLNALYRNAPRTAIILTPYLTDHWR
jgi:hypothetical protein